MVEAFSLETESPQRRGLFIYSSSYRKMISSLGSVSRAMPHPLKSPPRQSGMITRKTLFTYYYSFRLFTRHLLTQVHFNIRDADYGSVDWPSNSFIVRKNTRIINASLCTRLLSWVGTQVCRLCTVVYTSAHLISGSGLACRVTVGLASLFLMPNWHDDGVFVTMSQKACSSELKVLKVEKAKWWWIV